MATTLCQGLLFSIDMVAAPGFDATTAFEVAATMCGFKNRRHLEAMQATHNLGCESDEEVPSSSPLMVVAARIHSMPRTPAIEQASITSGVLNNCLFA